MPATYPVGFETCFIPCFNYYMAEGMDAGRALTTCAIACGLSEAAVRAAFLEYTGLYGAGSAFAEGGFLSLEAWGVTGAAAAGLGLLAVLGIAFAVHDLVKGLSKSPPQPPVTRVGCSGSYTPPGNITGWSIPFEYPGCVGAWDHAQVNAQAVCDAHLTCPGTCPNGEPCKPVAILIDRVDETRYVFTCEAEGKFTCECGCQ
jgi:hypothetical protein